MNNAQTTLRLQYLVQVHLEIAAIYSLDNLVLRYLGYSIFFTINVSIVAEDQV
jgi:hypothetical protein